MKDFSISQLLNLIHLARKTGTLFVDEADKRVRMVFENGMLTYARMETGKADLAEILRHSRKIDFAGFRSIREKLKSVPENELGLELVMAGDITQPAILDCIRQYSTSLIHQMYTWNVGDFEFRAEEKAPEGKILLNLPLDEFIAEGVNNLSEQELLQKEIPELDVELIFTDQIESVTDQLDLGIQEWQVISKVNTGLTLADVARQTGINEYEIRRAASRLMQAGILQIRPQADMINPVDKMDERMKKENIIKEFITQIKQKLGSK